MQTAEAALELEKDTQEALELLPLQRNHTIFSLVVAGIKSLLCLSFVSDSLFIDY